MENKYLLKFLTIVFITLVSGFSKTYATIYGSSAVTQITTATSAGATDQQVLRVSVTGSGGGGGLKICQINFTMQNTNNADVSAAKLYYTGTSNVFATTTQLGATVNNPTGTISFSFTSADMINSTYYFWLAFDISPTATKCTNNVDALVAAGGLFHSTTNCASSTGVTPTSNNPAGSRQIQGPGCWTYCTSTGSLNTTGWLSGVTLNDLTSTSGWDGGYLDGTASTANVFPGESYDLIITRQNQSAAYTLWTAAWIDYNNDGDFIDGGEQVAINASSNTAGAESRTVSITVPSTATVGNTRLRVMMRYNTAPTGPCDNTTYMETEDYTVNIQTPIPMNFVSSTCTQPSTATVTQGSTGNQILGIQIVTTGNLNPLSLTSLSLNTTGSTNAATDLTHAKIYYTKNSSTFSTDNLLYTKFSPNGAYTVSLSQGLSPGTNYFWVVYNINSTATASNVVDAACTSLTVGTAKTPTTTAPAGTRQIVALTTGAYCSATGTGTNNYITNVSLGNIQNTTTLSGASNYNNYTAQSTTLYIGEENEIYIDSYTNTKSAGLFVGHTKVWIDWNRDGDFADADEDLGFGAVSGNNQTWRIGGTFSVSNTAVTGTTRMRVVTVGSNTAPTASPCAYTNAEIEDYSVVVAELPEMTYSAINVTQVTDNVNAGTTNNQILMIEVVTSGIVNPLRATSFSFNGIGTTAYANITASSGKLYSTGSSATFSTSTQLGSAITLNGTTTAITTSVTLSSGSNYFWIACDVDVNAPTGNFIDAQCTSVTVDGVARTPGTTAPAGNRPIIAATNMAYVSCTSTQNSSTVALGDQNQQILGVEVVVTGALNALSATSFTFNTTGTTGTITNQIENAKLWFSSNTSTFSTATATQVGSTVAAPNGTFTITPTTTLVQGTNYFWLTYDIKPGAECNPKVVDARCTAVTVAAVSRTPTVQNPAGTRLINCGTPYYSVGSVDAKQLASWNSKRDGTGTAPASLTTSTNAFYLQGGHKMTTSGTFTMSQLFIEQGGYITASYVINIDTLRINNLGVFEQQAKATNFTYIKKFVIENGGTWLHNNNGYLANSTNIFYPNSIQWFKQIGGGSVPSGTSWGNLILDISTASNFNIENCFLTIQGDFEWRKVGNNNYYTNGATETWNIGGDLKFTGAAWYKGVAGTGGMINTINVGGDLIMEAGVLGDYSSGNSSSGLVINVGGNVKITGGTMNINQSPGGISELNLSSTVTGAITDVTWTQTGGTVTLCNTNIESGKNVTLIGSKLGDIAASRTLTLETGSALYCSTYPVSGAGNFTCQAGTILGMGHTSGYTGNIAVTGTKTNSFGANFVYYGTGNQNSGTFTTTGGTVTYQLASLAIDKTSTTSVTLGQAIRVSGTAPSYTAPYSGTTVSNHLQLIQGLLTTTTTNIIEVDAGATANAGNATSYVNGPILKKGSTAFVFPTGKGGYWARIGMTAPSAASDFRAEYFATAYSNTTTMATQAAALQLDHVSSLEYWLLDRLNGTTGSTSPTLYWESASRSGILKCDSLTVARFNGTAWENSGNPASCTYAATGSVTTGAAVTAFSPFTFASRGVRALNPLPVTLVEFKAKCFSNKTGITWTTATETNANSFLIEKSFDGENFTALEKVEATGNSNKISNYLFYDNSKSKGETAYYRLKMVDNDGSSTYSEAVTANCIINGIELISYYPERTSLTATISADLGGIATIEMVDMQGRVVLTSTNNLSEGFNEFNLPCNLNSGIYMLAVTTSNSKTTHKVIVK